MSHSVPNQALNKSSTTPNYQLAVGEQRPNKVHPVIYYSNSHITQYPSPHLISLPSALVSIWTRPSLVMSTLALRHDMIWAFPIGILLFLCYLRFFCMTLLGISVSEWSFVGSVTAVLIGWLFCTILLFTICRLFDATPVFKLILGLSAWTFLPYAVRDLVQTIYMLNVKATIAWQGLSGLVELSRTDSWAIQLIQYWLSYIDIYSIFHLALVVITVRISSRLSPSKSWQVVGLYAATILMLGSLVQLL